MRFLFSTILIVFFSSIVCAQTESPNILLIIADDLGIDVMNGYGIDGTKPNTPTLDSLRENGLTFTNCWATPQCTPTRAAIMSGLYGIKTGVMRPPGPLDPAFMSLFNSVQKTPELDYNMSVIGKWHLGGGGNNNLDHPAQLGVDYFEGFFSSGVEDYYDWTKLKNGETEQVTEYATTHLTNAAIDWVSAQDQPWFLWLAHAAPHSPLQTPPAGLFTTEITNERRSTYFAMIEAMDFEIGRLLDNLEEAVRNNTLIFFIGDNGTPNAVNEFYPRGHVKGSIYEGGVRVPMIVSGAPLPRKGATENGLVHVADLHATILELMGRSLPGGINNSLSLKPLLEAAGQSSRTINYVDYEDDGVLVWATRTAQYKLIEYEDGRQEFYDIIADLKEENNLINNLSVSQLAIKNRLATEANTIRTDWSCQDGILNGNENSIDDCGGLISNTVDLASLGFALWPNPNRGSFQIVIPKSASYVFDLYSSSGNLLKRKSGNGTIRFQGLASGTYGLSVRDANQTLGTMKVVVQ